MMVTQRNFRETALKIIDWILLLGLVALLALSVVSYFQSLSQYATADQTLTLKRLKIYLAHPHSSRIASGSSVSYLLVAGLGEKIGPQLAAFFQNHWGAWLDIVTNSILPFSLIQLMWVLSFLMFAAAVISSYFKGSALPRSFTFFIFALIMINFPMFKGLCKVLKYDAFSLALGSVGIFLFSLGLQRRSPRLRLIAFAITMLGYLEKETMIAALAFELCWETLLIFSARHTTLKTKLFTWFRRLSYCGILTLLIFWLIVTSFRHDPRKILELLTYMPGYFQAVPFFFFLLPPLGVFALHFLSTRGSDSFLTRTFTISRNRTILWGLQAILLALWIFAMTYQRNNLVEANYAPAGTLPEGIYIGPDFAPNRITTLDVSPIVTRIKIFFDEIRIFYYQVPEPVTLILTFSPALILCLSELTSFPYLLLGALASFIPFTYAAFALIVAPVQGQYLSLPHLVACYLGGVLFIYLLGALWFRQRSLARVGLLGLMLSYIRVVTLAAPAHFAYHSIFRSADYENTDYLSLARSAPWTWAGWGEFNYMVERSLLKTHPEPIVLANDYIKPFRENPGVTNVLYNGNIDKPPYFPMLCKLYTEAHPDYLILSKNVAYRFEAPNYIMNRHRSLARYTAKVGKQEFAWLFNVKELVSALDLPCRNSQ